MSQNVVIVESPAKAKTINKYLGKDYTVIASYGHVRDLPAKNGSVDTSNDFSMIWQVDSKGEKHIKDIEKAVKDSKNLYLATDPDREGEAISWHVLQVLAERNLLDQKNVKRIVFHEITKNAVQQAIQAPRDVNNDLVEAYLTRRALDYLVGFNLSPVLWRKLPGARSAGRVQSVALRLIVEREQEIDVFKSQEYWSINGLFITQKQTPFKAKLTHYQHQKLEKFSLTTQAAAEAVVMALKQDTFHVADLEKKQVKRHPAAPFITSTLQQEAARKLGFSASQTMKVAQRLYEGVAIGGETTGLITYMRTDSVTLAQEAVQGIRDFLNKNYGKNYVPSQARTYKSRAKNAQEAHEAIRPTMIHMKPEDVASYLDSAQLKLYELIWKRTIASQMESALFDQLTVDISNTTGSSTFRASGLAQVFDGFLRIYQEGVDDEETEKDDAMLPPMGINEALITQDILSHQHFTQAPPRYSEATLVKKLEELGIGRPSTYASLIQVLQDRDYVRLEKKYFIPEDRGRLVTSFLTHFFNQYVAYDFTAALEEQLDDISSGKLSWKQVLGNFWKDFHQSVETMGPVRLTEVIDRLEADLSTYLFKGQPKEERICPKCQKGHLSLKLSKFGAFLGCSDYPTCAYTQKFGANSSEETAIEEPATREPVVLGTDPVTGETITVRTGPYGPYVQWDGSTETPTAKTKSKKPPKPKRVGLPKGLTEESITLAQALRLKELPKVLGQHPDTNENVSVGLGRFGPFIKYEALFVSIPKTDSVLDMTLERALELIKEKQEKGPTTRGRKKATS